jgi:hypothetical protein
VFVIFVLEDSFGSKINRSLLMEGTYHYVSTYGDMLVDDDGN